MARPGAGGLACGGCGSPVPPGEPVCPSCGAHLETARCGRCGFRAPRAEFLHHRCPRCGHRADLGRGGVMVAAALAAGLLLLALAFSVWK
ncbi:MAG: zinc ribbon domain-containing protein [Nitrospinota bacterium]